MTGPLPCPVCGYGNRQGAQVCEDCGLAIPQYQACVSCGFMNTADSRFCGNCGMPVGNQRKQSAGPAATRAPVPPATAGQPPPPASMPRSQAPPSVPHLPPSEPGSEPRGAQGVSPEPSPPSPHPAAFSQHQPPSAQLPVPQLILQPGRKQPTGRNVDPIVGAPLPSSAAPRFKLVHVGTGLEITLPMQEGELVVGRPGGNPDVDVSGFPEATVVSRKHARLIISPGGKLQVEDLGSANGTYVNNARIRGPVPLNDGDRLAFGQGAKVVFTVHLP